MTIVNTKHTRPLRPGVVGSAFCGRLGHQLKVGYRLAAMTHGSSNAVCACITSANHNYIFPGSSDEFAFIPIGFQLTLFRQKKSFLILSEKFLVENSWGRKLWLGRKEKEHRRFFTVQHSPLQNERL
jgi:hypothetical protein